MTATSVNISIKDLDLGWNAFKKEMTAADGDNVTVGVHAKDAARRAFSVASEADISNVDAAIISEYGGTMHTKDGKSHFIPPRPFLSLTLSENIRKYAMSIGHMFAKIILSKAEFSARDMLTRLGMTMANDTKRNIVNGGKFQPLAPLTLKKRRDKGNFDERPLFDTGQLANSIWYEVHSGGTSIVSTSGK